MSSWVHSRLCWFASCPLRGSNAERLVLSKCHPLLPQQRTQRSCYSTSVKCHNRTHAPQQTTSYDDLFDHFIGAGEQGRRYFEAKFLRGFEIDNEFELGRLHHREVGRLRALKDFSGVDASLAKRISKIGSVADQAACRGPL